MRSIEKTRVQKMALTEDVETLLPEIARLYYVEHLSVSTVAERLKNGRHGIFSHAVIQHAIQTIDSRQMVTISIRSATQDEESKSFVTLEEALASCFNLDSGDVRVVWNSTVKKDESPKSNKDDSAESSSPTKHEMGRKASILISNWLNPKKNVNTVVVGPGRAVGLAMSHIHIDRPDLNILPFTGMMGIKRMNASPISNGRLLEKATSGTLHWFHTPAILPKDGNYCDSIKWINSLGILKSITSLYEQSDLVITSVGAEDRLLRWLKSMNMEETVKKYKQLTKRENKPVGSIGGALIDSEGNDFNKSHQKDMPWQTQGFTIKRMGDMVKEGKRVLLVAGDDEKHVDAIYALVKNNKANALVTDTTTAHKLLEKAGYEELIPRLEYQSYPANGAMASRRPQKASEG